MSCARQRPNRPERSEKWLRSGPAAPGRLGVERGWGWTPTCAACRCLAKPFVASSSVRASLGGLK